MTDSLVGIIANPAAGKDIRRLVAHASTFDNNEKVNIVRRVLLGLDAVRIPRVLIMPDYFRIGAKALEGLSLELAVDFLELPGDYSPADSHAAATQMRERGATCIVTLGGDGTNRMVAKGCGEVPLVPISTGTNNVFPAMVEGTIAGLAAGLVASGIVDGSVLHRTARLDILRDGEPVDIALVDAVTYAGQFIGSRAIWEAEGVRQIVLTRADPYSIGLSSIGGNLDAFDLAPEQGLAIEAGEGALSVLAPIAPGLIRRVGIKSFRRLSAGDRVRVESGSSVLALDGERTLVIHQHETAEIQFSTAGPCVVDIRAALLQAAEKRVFVKWNGSAPQSD